MRKTVKSTLERGIQRKAADFAQFSRALQDSEIQRITKTAKCFFYLPLEAIIAQKRKVETLV